MEHNDVRRILKAVQTVDELNACVDSNQLAPVSYSQSSRSTFDDILCLDRVPRNSSGSRMPRKRGRVRHQNLTALNSYVQSVATLDLYIQHVGKW